MQWWDFLSFPLFQGDFTVLAAEPNMTGLASHSNFVFACESTSLSLMKGPSLKNRCHSTGISQGIKGDKEGDKKIPEKMT